MSRNIEKQERKGGTTSSSSSSSSSRSRSSSSSSSSSSDSCSPNRRHYKRRQYELQKYRKNQYDEFDLEPKKPLLWTREIEEKKDKTRRGESSDEEIDGYPIEDQPLEKVPVISNWSDKTSVSTTSSVGSNKDTSRRQPSMTLDEDKLPEPPAPPSITKARLQVSKPGATAKTGIQMKLPTPRPTQAPAKKINVASAFNNDSDDEVEEMPAECKMRMRNIGRDTPTSSGPNSFGKTKQGFVDTKKVFERNLRQAYAD